MPLPEGWDEYDPNDHERTGEPGYEESRRKTRLRRMIEGYDAKEQVFIDGAGTDGSE